MTYYLRTLEVKQAGKSSVAFEGCLQRTSLNVNIVQTRYVFLSHIKSWLWDDADLLIDLSWEVRLDSSCGSTYETIDWRSLRIIILYIPCCISGTEIWRICRLDEALSHCRWWSFLEADQVPSVGCSKVLLCYLWRVTKVLNCYRGGGFEHSPYPD